MTLKKLLKKYNVSEQTVSTLLGAAVVIVIGILIFNYFKGTNTTTPNGTQDSETNQPNANGEIIPSGLPSKHIVAKGEDLWVIAVKYYNSGYNWVDIAKENNIANPNTIFVGQELNIPKVAVKLPEIKTATATTPVEGQIGGNNYTVVKGDTLWSISVRAYGDGYKWSMLAKANELVNPNVIHPGNVLQIPR